MSFNTVGTRVSICLPVIHHPRMKSRPWLNYPATVNSCEPPPALSARFCTVHVMIAVNSLTCGFFCDLSSKASVVVLIKLCKRNAKRGSVEPQAAFYPDFKAIWPECTETLFISFSPLLLVASPATFFLHWCTECIHFQCHSIESVAFLKLL